MVIASVTDQYAVDDALYEVRKVIEARLPAQAKRNNIGTADWWRLVKLNNLLDSMFVAKSQGG
jgi:hypothetical protein